MKKPQLADGANFSEKDFPFQLWDDKGKLFPEYSKPLVSLYETVTDKAPKEISIYEALYKIQSGEIRDKIEKLRAAKTKEEKEKLKQGLLSITVSGAFTGSHSAASLKNHSGFIQVDIDKVKNVLQLKDILCKDVFTLACFVSPSGTGIKVIVKIQTGDHDKSFDLLSKYYLKKYYVKIDSTCRDIGRLMFLSYDKDLYMNLNSLLFERVSIEVETLISRIELLQKDITGSYDNWRDIGFAIADQFKETGRALFHRVSKYYLKYTPESCNKQYNDCLRGKKGKTIKTFFQLTKQAGITLKPVNTPIQATIKNENIVDKPQPENLTTNKFLIVEKFLAEKYDFRYNEVSNEIERKSKVEKEYTPLNENNIYRELQHNNISFSQNNLQALFRSDWVKPYNPIKEYFENLPEWDGQTDYLNKLCGYITAKDQERFTRHLKKALVRCIACSLAEAFNKHAFILIGGQNSGKSSFIRWFCPPKLKMYYTEHLSQDKDGLISLSDNFIINLDELATMDKGDINKLKSMLSQDTVKLRRPFDRKATTGKRIANFFGSTDKDEFLTDVTGSVRWLCFVIEKIDFNYTAGIDIDLLWSQIFSLFKSGFDYKVNAADLEENEKANSDFHVRTSEMELIQKYYTPAKKGDEAAEALTATDILQKLRGETLGVLNISAQNIGRALKFLNFEKVSERIRDEKIPRKVYWVKSINN